MTGLEEQDYNIEMLRATNQINTANDDISMSSDSAISQDFVTTPPIPQFTTYIPTQNIEGVRPMCYDTNNRKCDILVKIFI